jgi:hypothetical protein
MWKFFKWYTGPDRKRVGGLYRYEPEARVFQAWAAGAHNWTDMPPGNRLEKSLEEADPLIVPISEAEARGWTGPIAAERSAERKAAIASGQGPSWGRAGRNRPPGRGAS